MHKENKTENLLVKFLGAFWLIDGILQFQPGMFTSSFVENVLKLNLPNQPQVISQLINFGIRVFYINPVFENLLFALLQIGMGVVLLFSFPKKWKKIALWISIPWCLIVWVFGEGLGNLFTGSASFYTGAPGSVILYLIIALFLLFPKDLPYKYLPKVAGLMFFLGGILNEIPHFWIKGMQTMFWSMSQQDNFSFISFPAKSLNLLATNALMVNIFASGILVILGILLMLKPSKILGWIIFVFLIIVWWISQDFGGIFTFPFGTATDPNSALLFMLFLTPLLTQENTKEESGEIDYGKWFIAIMLLVSAIFAGLILGNPIHTYQKEPSGSMNMNMEMR